MSILTPYSQLCEEQRALIAFCNSTDRSIFIEGPPWSGKSFIALYSAKAIVEKSGSGLLFMVSNNAMYGYMSRVLGELGVGESADVATKDWFFWDMASRARISISLDLDYEENYDRILACLLKDEVEEKYGLIVVGEVQDYRTNEWELLKRIAHRIICYGDFKQAVYDNKVRREDLIEDCIHRQIRLHNRDASTNELMRVRHYFFDDWEHVEAKDDAVFVMHPLATDVRFSTIDIKSKDELKAIIAAMEALEGEGRRVAIICPDNRFAKLSIYLESHGIKHSYYRINSDLKGHDFTSTTPLLISLFNAEGLHFDDVVLFGFDECNYIIEMKQKEDRLKNLLYVGMTRARRNTYIIRSEKTVKELKAFDGEMIHSYGEKTDK